MTGENLYAGGFLQRSRFNLTMFIISYSINNLVSGVLYDTYVNYLQEVSLSTATSFWAFYGYATFISALLLFLVPRVGYRALLMLCSLSCSAALLSVIWLDSPLIFSATTLLALVGVQLHFIMLAPYVATYTEGMGDGKIKWYTRAYYTGYIGYFIATYLGGVLTVKMFSLCAGISYDKALELTRFVSDMEIGVHASYLEGCQRVLFITAVLSVATVVPVLLMRESPRDYMGRVQGTEKKSWSRQLREVKGILLRRDVLMYLLYWSLISFAMGLFSSYFTVYLNRNLHMDKAMASLLVSISYIAIVLFMFLTPLAVRKLGQVGTICFTVLMSVPFMLVIAEGARFGFLMVPVVGGALFMRAGLANLGSPAESSLNMSLVPAAMRPAFTSLINVLAGLVSIVSGNFTGQFLFLEQEGYRQAYYIAAGLYLMAGVVMFLGLWKHNRPAEDHEGGEENGSYV